MGSMWGRCRVDVGSMWGQCGVDVGSMRVRCKIDYYLRRRMLSSPAFTNFLYERFTELFSSFCCSFVVPTCRKGFFGACFQVLNKLSLLGGKDK